MGAESLFEYGSRVGFWRLMKMFEKRDMPTTIYACALALEGQPKSAAYIKENSPRIDVCCHGWRWWRQHNLPEEEEREHIRLANPNPNPKFPDPNPYGNTSGLQWSR